MSPRKTSKSNETRLEECFEVSVSLELLMTKRVMKMNVSSQRTNHTVTVKSVKKTKCGRFTWMYVWREICNGDN